MPGAFSWRLSACFRETTAYRYSLAPTARGWRS
jgi:hypothetical protein